MGQFWDAERCTACGGLWWTFVDYKTGAIPLANEMGGKRLSLDFKVRVDTCSH